MSQSPRFQFLQALAWRIVAELYRRHASHRSILLSSVHPGSSLDGYLRLQIHGERDGVAPPPPLRLVLGGPDDVRGRWFLGDQLERGADFVAPMISQRPEQLIDRIDSECGLRAPVPLPPSNNAVLAVRCLADLLEQRAFSRPLLRAAPALMEYSVGVNLQPWTALADPGGAKAMADICDTPMARTWASQFIALHAADDGAPLSDAQPELTGALFNLKDGTVLLVRGGHVVQSLAIRPLYMQFGRKLQEVVGAVIAHFGT